MLPSKSDGGRLSEYATNLKYPAPEIMQQAIYIATLRHEVPFAVQLGIIVI